MSTVHDILAVIGGLSVFCWLVLVVWIVAVIVRERHETPDPVVVRDRIGVRR